MIVGLKDTKTGDTLLNWNDPRTKKQPIQLPTIGIPPPVFVCSIEPESSAEERNLEQALEHLQREDPSLKVLVDEETGQRLISGMGELHLEVVHAKLVNDMKAKCKLGRMWIRYRETLKPNTGSGPIVWEEEFSKDIMGKRQRAAMRMTIESMDHDEDDNDDDSNGNGDDWGVGAGRKGNPMHRDDNIVTVDYQPKAAATAADGTTSTTTTATTNTSLSEDEVIRAVRQGTESALASGPLAQFPLQNLRIRVDEIDCDATTSKAALYSCAVLALRHALQPILSTAQQQQQQQQQHQTQSGGPLRADQLAKHSPCTLLEPIMDVSVTVPTTYFGAVLSDLKSARSAQILSMDDGHGEAEELRQHQHPSAKESTASDDAAVKTARQRFLHVMQELSPRRGGSGGTSSSSSSSSSDTQGRPSEDTMARERVLQAHVPLSSMLGYSRSLRALTKGHGKLSMNLHGYGSMSRERVEAVLQEMRGF